jgi:hypothetical protein
MFVTLTPVQTLLLAAISLSLISEYPQPSVREEQQVVVNGVKEVWQLRWKEPPHPACVAGEPGAFTCPCKGYAYAEAGALEVVRLREGREVDRMPIRDGLMEIPADGVMVQRWPPDESDLIVQQWGPSDGEAGAPDSPGFPQMMANRGPVQIMNFADYDHDGEKTEFFFRTAAPCGEIRGIVIGVSKNKPYLHAFGSTSSPNQPIDLSQEEWDTLGHATRNIELIKTPCGDDREKREITVRLSWTAAGIIAEPREWACPGGFKAGRFIPK